MIFNVEVKKRIAKYLPTDEKYVCGNSGDQLKFSFDEEWEAHEEKTARFTWNGKYFDQVFTGDTVEIPVITKTNSFSVGVYVGEAPDDEALLSSTNVVISCELSVRCTKSTPSAGSGESYTNEAKGYAEDAKGYAEDAKGYAEEAKKSSYNSITVDDDTLIIVHTK